MFSIGDKVHYKEWDLIGVVEKVEGNVITVRFKEFVAPIGIERVYLTIVEKTQNERELLHTRMQNLITHVLVLIVNMKKYSLRKVFLYLDLLKN